MVKSYKVTEWVCLNCGDHYDLKEQAEECCCDCNLKEEDINGGSGG